MKVMDEEVRITVEQAYKRTLDLMAEKKVMYNTIV